MATTKEQRRALADALLELNDESMDLGLCNWLRHSKFRHRPGATELLDAIENWVHSSIKYAYIPSAMLDKSIDDLPPSVQRACRKQWLDAWVNGDELPEVH